METAIGDSQEYKVLSFEEIDELKKQIGVLSSRIDAIRSKLAIENKLHDATTSLNRLDSQRSREINGRVPGKREDLAQELWRLETKLQELQTRLLQHTAGVLQMTHKGYLEEEKPANKSNGTNGYINRPNSIQLLSAGYDFDDNSFYQTLDSLLDSGDGPTNGEVASALTRQTESILEIERQLWGLNQRLRDSISQASAGRQTIPAPPVPESSDPQNVNVALNVQIDYLQKGLDAIQRTQVDSLQGYKQSAYATEERLEDLNTQLRGIIVRSSQGPNPQHPLPPEVSGRRPDEQIAFLEGGLDALEQSVQKLQDDGRKTSSKSLAHEERAGQYENAIQTLWQSLSSDEDELSSPGQDENDTAQSSVLREPFSLESFSAKVRSLHPRLKSLMEQKDILGRQIQQQRELNSKSDIEKDARIGSLTAELERVNQNLDAASKDNLEGINELSTQLDANNDAKNQLLTELQDKNGAITSFEAQLQTLREDQANQVAKTRSLEQIVEQKSAEAEKARSEMANVEGEMVRLQTELTVARAELDGAYGTRAQRAAEVASHPALQKEVANLGERNTALVAEITSIKAKHESTDSVNAELNQRVQNLQRELSETIGEYEMMTKSSIDYEKEREQLENTIDSMRDRCEALATQLSDEKVRWLGVKSPGPPGSRDSMEKGATSTTVLKNEFKKMMRETRAENMKALRVSHIVRVITGKID